MRKPKKIIIIVTLVAIVLVASIFATFAVWTTMPAASVLFEMGVVNENPSLKYQLFVPVDINNIKVEGSYDFVTKVYTLDEPSRYDDIVGLALVGYEGGIALDKLEVADTFLYNIGGVEETFDVKCVLVDISFREYYLRSNTEIIILIIPQNVDYIADGAFMAMENLTTLTYLGTGEILVGDHAFAGCTKLTTPHMPDGRVVVGR